LVCTSSKGQSKFLLVTQRYLNFLLVKLKLFKMNKQFSKVALFSAMFLVLFNACQKDNEQSSAVAKTEISGKNGYLAFKDELAVLKEAFIPVSINPTFRKVVYQEVAKKFDGEDNVLIKTLITSCKKEGFDLEAALNKNLPAGQNVQSILGGLVRKGKKRHAHLYIPNFDNVVSADLRSGSGLNTRNANYPTLVSRPDNESILNLTGTEYNGSTYVTVPNVNEAYSMNNEVWVMSVNERVNGEGLPVYEEPDGGGGTGGNDPGNPTSTYGYCRNSDVGTRENLLGFRMNDILEPWFDGGPEMRLLPLDLGAVANLANLPANLRDLGESATLSLTINGFEGIFKRNWKRRQAVDRGMLYPDEFDKVRPHTTRVTIGGDKADPTRSPTYNATWEESAGKFFHWSLVTQAGANFNNLKAVTYILFEDDASGIFAKNGEKVEIPIKLGGVTNNIVGDFNIKIPLDDDHDQAGSFIIPRENAPGVCNQSVFYTTGNWEVWSGWCKF
jgi:hypothetical protein